MKTLDAVFLRIAIVALLIGGVAVCVGAYWVAWPFHVMQISQVSVVTPNVETGELFEYSMDYCKNPSYGNMYAMLQRSLTDGITYNLPVEYGPLAAGCHSVIMTMVMPPVPDGNYKLVNRLDYFVNPLRTISVEVVTGIFHVSTKQRLKEQLRQQLPDVLPEVRSHMEAK